MIRGYRNPVYPYSPYSKCCTNSSLGTVSPILVQRDCIAKKLHSSMALDLAVFEQIGNKLHPALSNYSDSFGRAVHLPMYGPFP